MLTPAFLRATWKPVLAAALVFACTCCATTPKGVGAPSVSELNSLITQSTTKILQAERNARGGGGGADDIWVACLPMKVRGAVDLGSSANAFNNAIEREVTNSRLFRPIARNLIDVGVRASGYTDPEDLFLKDLREKFIAAIAENQFVPEFFLLAELNTLQQRQGGYVVERQIDLNLKLVNATSGEIAQFQEGTVYQSIDR